MTIIMKNIHVDGDGEIILYRGYLANKIITISNKEKIIFHKLWYTNLNGEARKKNILFIKKDSLKLLITIIAGR
jgi:hypothetical protein